jgi:hypothetical protein
VTQPDFNSTSRTLLAPPPKHFELKLTGTEIETNQDRGRSPGRVVPIPDVTLGTDAAHTFCTLKHSAHGGLYSDDPKLKPKPLVDFSQHNTKTAGMSRQYLAEKEAKKEAALAAALTKATESRASTPAQPSSLTTSACYSATSTSFPSRPTTSASSSSSSSGASYSRTVPAASTPAPSTGPSLQRPLSRASLYASMIGSPSPYGQVRVPSPTRASSPLPPPRPVSPPGIPVMPLRPFTPASPVAIALHPPQGLITTDQFAIRPGPKVWNDPASVSLAMQWKGSDRNMAKHH